MKKPIQIVSTEFYHGKELLRELLHNKIEFDDMIYFCMYGFNYRYKAIYKKPLFGPKIQVDGNTSGYVLNKVLKKFLVNPKLVDNFEEEINRIKQKLSDVQYKHLCKLLEEEIIIRLYKDIKMTGTSQYIQGAPETYCYIPDHIKNILPFTWDKLDPYVYDVVVDEYYGDTQSNSELTGTFDDSIFE